MEELRNYRRAGKLSQRGLSRSCRPRVPVWKLSLAECGHLELSPEEQAAVMDALRRNFENLAVKATEVGHQLSRQQAV